MKTARYMLAFVALLALAFTAHDADAKAKAKAKKKEPAPAAEAQKDDTSKRALPWTLRDHYTFTIGNNTLIYGVETAEWTLASEKLGTVVDDTKFTITFADGTTWDSTAMGKATTDRGPFTNELGKATHFWLDFPPKDGIVVRCSILMFVDQPYFLIRIGIGNTGNKPIEIAKISPAVLGPNGIHSLGQGAVVGVRHIVARDSFPVFDPLAPPLLALFYDKANAFSIAMGVLPLGVSAPGVSFAPSGAAWQGDASLTYSPPVRIEPGQKFEADPFWICAGLDHPSKVDTYYAWAWRTMRPQALKGEIPRAWTSLSGVGSDADVYGAAKAWSDAKPGAALVPAIWEGRPGSLEGITPNFPKNMAKVASTIHGLGLKAGLTVDALLASGGPSTEAGADGRKWYNVSAPEGMKAAVDHLRKAAGWDFDFFVVALSEIPDEVLKVFHMTRVQANDLAIQAMTQAAQGKPVFPAAATKVKADLDAWLEAAAGSSRMADFQVVPGPVGFDATGVESLDDTLVAAMTFFNGPIELVGKPNAAVAGQFASLLGQPPLPGHPVDAARTSPHVWHIVARGPEGNRGGSVVAFPGGGPWSLSELELDKDLAVRLWDPATGKFIDAKDGALPAADKLTVYGLMPVVDHPVLMGASAGLDLLLNRVTNLNWNADKGSLSGSLQGSRKPATGYVFVPDGWTLKSGKANVSATQEGGGTVVSFPVSAGAPTSFQLEFRKK